MTPGDIAQYRLVNQGIASPTSKTPSEVVASLGAMQAQDYLGALWAIGLRLPHATEAGIERAISDRTILRTWPMRGTLHFVATQDARWMLELLTPRVIASTARRYQQLELDDAVFGRSRELFIDALQGGRQLTRDAMHGVLEAAHISTADQRGIHILSRLAQEGLLCFGAREGKQQTFALLAEWAPEAKSMERDEALAELARRYFTGHGPATLHDFVWWSGLKVSDARHALDMAASQLGHESMGGTVYWMPQGMPSPSTVAACVHLLPGFDEFMLGYRDRSASLDPADSGKIHPGGNGMFSPTVVIDGQVVGTWRRTVKKNLVVMTASPFAPLSRSEKQSLVDEVERFGEFLQLPFTFLSG